MGNSKNIKQQEIRRTLSLPLFSIYFILRRILFWNNIFDSHSYELPRVGYDMLRFATSKGAAIATILTHLQGCVNPQDSRATARSRYAITLRLMTPQVRE